MCPSLRFSCAGGLLYVSSLARPSFCAIVLEDDLRVAGKDGARASLFPGSLAMTHLLSSSVSRYRATGRSDGVGELGFVVDTKCAMAGLGPPDRGTDLIAPQSSRAACALRASCKWFRF